MYSPSLKATLEEPTGPANGILDMDNAAEAPTMANMS